ncbi:MAG: A24 family peptidase [Nitrospira sp.]
MVGELVVVLIMAMWTDLRTSRIPNWLTFSTVCVALVMHAWFGGLQEAIVGMMGFGAGLGLFLVLYLSGGVGAGDVKLMAAVGALVGPFGALVSGLLAIMVGGIYALGAMCYQWGIPGTGRKLASAVQGAALGRESAWASQLELPFRLRYAVAVAGGTLLFELGLHPFGA